MSKAAETAKPSSETSLEFDPLNLLNILLGRFRLILGVTLLFLIIGGLYLSFQVPQYTSTALMQLNVKEQPVLDMDSMTISSDDDEATQSQLDILQSPALIRRVVEKYKLQNAPEFNDGKKPKTLVWKAENAIKSAIKGEASEPPGDEEQQQEITMIQVTQNVMSRLNVYKDPLSYTVKVSFTSRDPKRASDIANSVVEEFLDYQIQSFTDTNKDANTFLNARVEELRKKVSESEEAVQVFTQKHGLFQLDGMTIDDQQLSELNSQLVQSRTELAQAQARLSRARSLLNSGGGIDSVSEVLNSGLIQALREKEAELLRQRSELTGHFGPNHPRISRINSEISDLQDKIAIENRKIVQALENELAISRVRVKTLESELGGLRGRQGSSSKQELELAELQREAQANRTIYESFLARMKQTGEIENLEQASAKIISKAELPLTPSAPNKNLIMALFLFIGGSVGVALALMLEYFNLGFVSPEAFEEKTGISCLGMLPEFEGKQTLASYTQDHPNSVYAEALRSIMAGLQFNDDKAPRSVLVLSSLPQEGKGWLSSSLGHIAASSGKKILLLDADLHRAKVSDVFDGSAAKTLNEYLLGEADIESILNKDSKSGLFYIASMPEKRNVQKLLESEKMKALMDYAHANFDSVIVDCPPVIGLADVLFLSRIVDSAMLVVRWSKTPRSVVQNALKVLSRAKIPLSGAVLSRIDLGEYKKHEFGSSYYYSQYSEYYRDDPKKPAGIKDMIFKFTTGN